MTKDRVEAGGTTGCSSDCHSPRMPGPRVLLTVTSTRAAALHGSDSSVYSRLTQTLDDMKEKVRERTTSGRMAYCRWGPRCLLLASSRISSTSS